MKKLMPLLIIISIFLKMDASAQTALEKEIVKLSADKYHWYTEKKIDAADDLYDDDLVFIHITGHISSKKEWISQMSSGSFVYNQINVKEASAKVYGNTAVLVGKASFVVNGGSRYNLIYTEVYTKKNDKWKLVNVHTTSGY